MQDEDVTLEDVKCAMLLAIGIVKAHKSGSIKLSKKDLQEAKTVIKEYKEIIKEYETAIQNKKGA